MSMFSACRLPRISQRISGWAATGAEVCVESSDDERDDVTHARAQMANGHLQKTPAAMVMAPKPLPRARRVESAKHEEDSSFELNSVERVDTPLQNVRNASGIFCPVLSCFSHNTCQLLFNVGFRVGYPNTAKHTCTCTCTSFCNFRQSHYRAATFQTSLSLTQASTVMYMYMFLAFIHNKTDKLESQQTATVCSTVHDCTLPKAVTRYPHVYCIESMQFYLRTSRKYFIAWDIIYNLCISCFSSESQLVLAHVARLRATHYKVLPQLTPPPQSCLTPTRKLATLPTLNPMTSHTQIRPITQPAVTSRSLPRHRTCHLLTRPYRKCLR